MSEEKNRLGLGYGQRRTEVFGEGSRMVKGARRRREVDGEGVEASEMIWNGDWERAIANCGVKGGYGGVGFCNSAK